MKARNVGIICLNNFGKIKNAKKDWHKETPAANGRFCKMAAVTPQTILYKFARYYPTASVVKAATSQSRWDVSGHAGQCGVDTYAII